MNEAFGKLDLLRQWVAAEVERDGRTASTMVRAGLLLDIIDTRAELLEALDGVKWKSADRDNMEFAARITYVRMDAIRAAIARARGAAQ